MKQFAKTYWKTLLFFACVGLVGGFFTGLYLMDSYPAWVQQEIYAQGLNDALLGVITAFQSAGYGIVLGAAGIFLGKKIDLWKDERTLAKKPVVITLVIGLFGGLVMILSDILFFGKYSQVILDSYTVKPTAQYLIAMVLYGGIIEEVMLRLFLMSLAAFALHKLFWRKQETTPVAALVLANVIAAILFAAGHLPATAMLLGITPMILLRCFLLNGGFGLAFGWLYRKYGLRYSMLAHGGCHIVSKLIWILLL